MKFALGTAAFNHNYGVTNTSYADLEQIQQILDLGLSYDVTYLDTAPAYGESQTSLGLCSASQDYAVITKVHGETPQSLEEQLQSSLVQLQHDSVYAVLLHDENLLLGSRAHHIYDVMQKLKSNGQVKKIGVSFYSPDKAEQTLEHFDLDLIQAPANILDRRFEKRIFQHAQRAGVEVHSRSLFLQGLLAISPTQRHAKFQDQADLIKFDQAAQEYGLTQLELAVSVLTQQPSIDCTIIGCIQSQQLIEIMQAYQKMMTWNDLNLNLESEHLNLLNPTQWNSL
tara:strand:- start:1675 stop:2523 length:849 start_codon:yes stop_codon:yes gene_type:complete